MASNYGKFGKPFKGFSQDDPIDSCMPGSFLDAPWDYNLGNCKQLMAQRCSENWDNKCQIYVNNIEDVTELKHFIESMANYRFCNLSDKSKCGVVCQPFNPINQISPTYCNTMGKDSMVDISQSLDTGLYNPVKLSPVYMGDCMKKCNKIEASAIKEDDHSVNYCLEFGFCGETLSNICKIADEKGEVISHPLLNQYCSLKTQKLKSPKYVQSKQQLNQHKQFKTAENVKENVKEIDINSDDKNKRIINSDNYSNNIGVISVIVVFLMISFLMIGSSKRRYN